MNSLVVGGDDHAHVVEPHTLPPLRTDEILNDFLVKILCYSVLGIVPLWHDVWNGRHQGRQIFYSGTIGAHEPIPLSVCWNQYTGQM